MNVLGRGDVQKTGRMRFREVRRWGRKLLVLQIEEAGHVTRLLGPYPDTEFETWWRDARTEDMTTSRFEVVK